MPISIRTGRLITAALAVVVAALLAAPASAAAPTDKLKRAGQIASPSVVLTHYSASGYLNDNRDGSSHGPYSLSWWGTGFFVSSDGYVATAAHVAAMTSDQVKNQMVEKYLVQDANATGCVAKGNCQQLIDSHRTGYQVASSLS